MNPGQGAAPGVGLRLQRPRRARGRELARGAGAPRHDGGDALRARPRPRQDVCAGARDGAREACNGLTAPP